MAKKKIVNKPNSQKKIIRDLARQERLASRWVNSKDIYRPWSRYVVLLGGLFVVSGAFLLVFLQSRQQIEVNSNKQEFITLREIMKRIQDSGEFSSPGVEWKINEECKYVPINEINITNKVYKEWNCSSTIQRPLAGLDDVVSLQNRLAAAVAEVLTTRVQVREGNNIVIETEEGHSCFVSPVPSGDNSGEVVGIKAGCRGSAYRSWYPNSEQRTTAEGKDAWRTFK